MTASHNLPSGSDSKESACNAGDRSLKPGSGGSLEKEMATTPVFLPGEFHRQSLVGWSMGCKELYMTEQLTLLRPRGLCEEKHQFEGSSLPSPAGTSPAPHMCECPLP